MPLCAKPGLFFRLLAGWSRSSYVRHHQVFSLDFWLAGPALRSCPVQSLGQHQVSNEPGRPLGRSRAWTHLEFSSTAAKGATQQTGCRTSCVRHQVAKRASTYLGFSSIGPEGATQLSGCLCVNTAFMASAPGGGG